MKKIFSILSLSIILSALFALPASAVGFKADNNLVVKNKLLDDHYFAGGNAEIDADTDGDLMIAAGELTINGNVHGDLTVVGGNVTIFGDVDDDLRVAGGRVSVFGNVGDDVVAFGGQVDIAKDAVVGGSLLGGAGLFTVDGTIKGDIQGAAGVIFLNGTVEGNVVVTVEDNLDVDQNAHIGGNLSYSAFVSKDIPAGVVQGKVLFNKFEDDADDQLSTVRSIYLGFKVTEFLASLLIILLLIFFVPNALVTSAEIAKRDVVKNLGVGLLTVIVSFIGAILLMITIIGIPLGLITFAALAIGIYLSKIFVAAWLAQYVMKYKMGVKRLRSRLFFGIFVALLLIYLVGFVPYVGWFISLVLTLIGVGNIALFKMASLKILKEKKFV